MNDSPLPQNNAPRAPGRAPAPSRPVAGESRVRRVTVRAISIGLVILAVVGGYWYFHRPATAPGPGAGAGGPPALPVTVAHPLKQKIIEWTEYPGQFAAVDFVELRSRVSGYLDSIHFQDGQIVKKGDLLFVVDPRPFQADLQVAQANLERDKAQKERADLDLTRYSVLAKKDFASQQQFESARATAQAAAATVKADDAAVAQARLNLEFTQITAPITGRIGRREVSVGDLIVGGAAPSTTLLTTIVSLDPLYFNYYISEEDFLNYQQQVRQGDIPAAVDNSVPIDVKLSDEKGWPHQGHLNFIDNRVDPGSGTILARALVPNTDLLITPGLFGRIRMPASGMHDVILIPDKAILSDQSQKIVMTVKADGTVEPKVIQMGPVYRGLRVVHSGLSEDDNIIVDGLLRAHPGGKVVPQPGKIELGPENS